MDLDTSKRQDIVLVQGQSGIQESNNAPSSSLSLRNRLRQSTSKANLYINALKRAREKETPFQPSMSELKGPHDIDDLEVSELKLINHQFDNRMTTSPQLKQQRPSS